MNPVPTVSVRIQVVDRQILEVIRADMMKNLRKPISFQKCFHILLEDYMGKVKAQEVLSMLKEFDEDG